MGPREVDQLYLWEIATLLGLAKEIPEPTKDAKDSTDANDARRPSGPIEGARELLRKRVLAARGKGPQPESPAIDLEAFKATAGALRVGT